MLGTFFKNIMGSMRPSSPAENLDYWFRSDRQFNKLYPQPMQVLARRHWTPLAVARKAAEYLAEADNVKILDIGSGVGKFCISAAYYRPNAQYYGIEQRQSLVDYADEARTMLGLHNVQFVQGNFTQLNFKDYHHFYFFNSFYENLIGTERIDESIAYSGELFKYYTRYFIQRLDEMPAGTKLVTYHSNDEEVPGSFNLVKADVNGLLKYWIKI